MAGYPEVPDAARRQKCDECRAAMNVRMDTAKIKGRRGSVRLECPNWTCRATRTYTWDVS